MTQPPRLRRKDVENMNPSVIDVGYHAQTLLRSFEPVGYVHSDFYGFSYYVYDINGFTVIDKNGDSFKNEARISYDVLDNLEKKAEQLATNNAYGNYTDEVARKEKSDMQALFTQFTDSVKQGIHDPSQILTFADYKRELIDQKKQHPEKDLISISSMLFKDYLRPEAKEKINAALGKKMEKYKSLPDKKEQLKSVLNDILTQKTKSRGSDFGMER